MLLSVSLNGQAHPVRKRGRMITDTFDLTTRTATGSFDITLETLGSRNIQGTFDVVFGGN
jgi:hypothetical protein